MLQLVPVECMGEDRGNSSLYLVIGKCFKKKTGAIHAGFRRQTVVEFIHR